DLAPFDSTTGTASQDDAGVSTTQLTLVQTVGTGRRTINLRIHGSIAPGAHITLDDRSYVEYNDSRDLGDWNSSAATSGAGTLSIDAVAGRSFSFTLSDVTMAPVSNATGKFTLSGTGRAAPF